MSVNLMSVTKVYLNKLLDFFVLYAVKVITVKFLIAEIYWCLHASPVT